MQKERLKIDKSCDTYLKNHSWTILRFWVHEINNSLDECLNKIRKVFK